MHVLFSHTYVKTKRLPAFQMYLSDFPQELFEAFECIQSRHEPDRRRRDGHTRRFSVEAVSALCKLLLRTPWRAQALLEFLPGEQGTRNSAQHQSCSLQSIYVDFLRDSLKSLQRLQYNPELSAELDQRETVDAIYRALSVLHFEVEHQMGELRHLCRELLNACWVEGSLLREEKLLSCMLRKQSHALLSLYSSVFTERTREKLLGPKSLGKGLFPFVIVALQARQVWNGVIELMYGFYLTWVLNCSAFKTFSSSWYGFLVGH